MIKIGFVEPTTGDWITWKTKCAIKTAKVLKLFNEGKKSKVTDLYKSEKFAYVTAYGGKCGWCERHITLDQFGDLDHYRPKSGVADENWEKVQYTRDGRSGNHDGYYWLAYDYSNLVFCCVLCNQVAAKRKWGKGIRFPVADFRAEIPGEETQEVPLLLHPIFDEPADHIDVDHTGVLVAMNDSVRGRATISVFGLNERDLPSARAEAFKVMIMKFDALWGSRHQIGFEETMRQMQALRNEPQEFAAVVRAAFKEIARTFAAVAKAAA